MMERLRILSAAWRDRDLNRLLVAFTAYCLLDQAGWVALLVLAYARGGATEAGLVAFGLLVPAALWAPLAALVGDRGRPERVLAVGYAFEAGAAFAIAVALQRDAPSVAVYGLGAMMIWAMGITEPLHHAILPRRTRTSTDLAAANVCSGTVDGLAACAGPALAALVLASLGPAPLFAVLGLLVLGAGIAILTLSEQPSTASLAPDPGEGDGALENPPLSVAATEGLRWLRAHPGALRLFSLFAVTYFFVGALDVVFVALAVERLSLPEAGAGWLAAGFGLGGVFGALSSAALIGRTRLTPAIALGGLLAGLPVAAIAAGGAFAPAFVALVASGCGTSLIGVAGRTLLQGITPVDVLARVFGAFEGMSVGVLALGAASAGIAIPTLGLSGVLLTLGFAFPVWLALGARTLLRTDADRRLPDAEHVRLLRGVPMLAMLPAYTVEALVQQLEPRSLRAGETLIREGEQGDRLFVVARGEACVSQHGRPLRVCAAGECVGEIALLADGRRTATVEAGDGGLEVLALGRRPFLEAIDAHARSHALAHRVARDRIRRDRARREGH